MSINQIQLRSFSCCKNTMKQILQCEAGVCCFSVENKIPMIFFFKSEFETSLHVTIKFFYIYAQLCYVHEQDFPGAPFP